MQWNNKSKPEFLATPMPVLGFLGSSDGKEPACNAGDVGSVPRLERSPRGGHGNPLHNSCLKNSMDRGVWRATVHGVTKSPMQLSVHTYSTMGGRELYFGWQGCSGLICGF